MHAYWGQSYSNAPLKLPAVFSISELVSNSELNLFLLRQFKPLTIAVWAVPCYVMGLGSAPSFIYIPYSSSQAVTLLSSSVGSKRVDIEKPETVGDLPSSARWHHFLMEMLKKKNYQVFKNNKYKVLGLAPQPYRIWKLDAYSAVILSPKVLGSWTNEISSCHTYFILKIWMSLRSRYQPSWWNNKQVK